MKLHDFDGKKTLGEAAEDVFDRVEKKGFVAFLGNSERGGETRDGCLIPGNLAMPRKQELYAALNRCRELIRIL